MKITIKSRYLVFPVNTNATKKQLVFSNHDKELYRLNIKLDYSAPNFYAYIDVSRFQTQTLQLSVSPVMDIHYRESDEIDMPKLYQEEMRPQVHFTPKSGWMNDPNGLIYMDGVYHMFFQYNPTEPYWDNMHWGHAVSTDLIHWQEKGIALYPDERGTMFSGSAIVDEKNLLGLNQNGNMAAVLFYTTTNPFCQNLSYSIDGFETIKAFGANPVVPNIIGENRDPKVIFCDELDCYIMALYLEDDIYCILKSNDLTNWEEVQRVHIPEENECPDIFPLHDEKGNRRWVLMGARDRYVVGSFHDGKFVEEQSARSLHYGASAYAGQTFSNLPEGRAVRIVWDKWHLPVQEFSGQMGFPMELSLCEVNGIYYVAANPIEEIKRLYRNSSIYENEMISPKQDFCVTLEDAPYRFKIQGTICDCTQMKLQVFGKEIDIDFLKNEVKLGKDTAPISFTENKLDITMIVDRCSIELFLDGGKIYMSSVTEDTICDRTNAKFSIKTNEKQIIEYMELTSLNSIWENEK